MNRKPNIRLPFKQSSLSASLEAGLVTKLRSDFSVLSGADAIAKQLLDGQFDFHLDFPIC